MSLWFRVFARSAAPPDPAALIAAVRAAVPLTADPAVAAGEEGWQQVAFTVAGGDTPVYLERFRRDEEGVRGDLQAWAAWLETCDYSPHHQPLMAHLIQTQQVFTVRRPVAHGNEIQIEQLCLAACRFLAAAADGVYQIDGQGVFAADGTLLVQEY